MAYLAVYTYVIVWVVGALGLARSEDTELSNYCVTIAMFWPLWLVLIICVSPFVIIDIAFYMLTALAHWVVDE